MRMEQLKYLCEINKYRSMNIASEKLHIAQQTLSSSIKGLESELNSKLFERNHRGVYPTPIGQEVIDWAEEVLCSLEHLKLKINTRSEKELSGKITIGIDSGLCLLVMPKIISTFKKIYSNIQLETHEMNREQTEQAVLDKRVDIGLINHYENQLHLSNPLLVYIENFQYTFFACVSKKSDLADLSIISLHTLAKYPFAMYDNGNIDLLCALEKFDDIKIIPSNNFITSSQLVSDNQAVSLFVKINHYKNPLFNIFQDSIKIIPIKEEFPFYSSYVLQRNNLENIYVKTFIDLFAATFLL